MLNKKDSRQAIRVRQEVINYLRDLTISLETGNYAEMITEINNVSVYNDMVRLLGREMTYEESRQCFECPETIKDDNFRTCLFISLNRKDTRALGRRIIRRLVDMGIAA